MLIQKFNILSVYRRIASTEILLFQEKPSKDHKVVSIAVLRLHDRSSLEACRVHEMEVVWLTQLIVRVCITSISVRVDTF